MKLVKVFDNNKEKGIKKNWERNEQCISIDNNKSNNVKIIVDKWK